MSVYMRYSIIYWHSHMVELCRHTPVYTFINIEYLWKNSQETSQRMPMVREKEELTQKETCHNILLNYLNFLSFICSTSQLKKNFCRNF